MNPRDYRDLASALVAKVDASVADLRTAASRAYYAAFHVALELLKKMGVKEPARWDAHTSVPEALRYSGDEEVASAARDLTDIRKARWSADYDMLDDAVEHQRTVRKLVSRGKQIIQKFDECGADPVRLAQARTKVRNWVGSAEGSGKGFTLL